MILISLIIYESLITSCHERHSTAEWALLAAFYGGHVDDAWYRCRCHPQRHVITRAARVAMPTPKHHSGGLILMNCRTGLREIAHLPGVFSLENRIRRHSGRAMSTTSLL